MSREKSGPSALEAWARQKTDGYDGVTIRNMTSSWRNGMAFCALIHRFRPDLIDFEKLDPCDILGNCSLAFEVAERQLGIPALLDPEDMAAHEIPDRLSVLTYVAQFYNTFKSLEKKSTVTNRLSLTPDDSVIKARPGDKSKSSTPEKVILKRTLDIEDEAMNEARKRLPTKSVMLSSATVCSECKNPVYISERIMFSKKLYHRSCFRCFNCERVLNPHTADVSPDGLLFCLENACHVELRRRSRESCLSVSDNRGSNISVVNSDQMIKPVINDNQPSSPKHESFVPSFKSATNVSPNPNRKDCVPLTPENRRVSLHANFPSVNGNASPDDKLAETNSLVRDRVSALRMKFFDECHGDPTPRSRQISSRDTEETRERHRSRSRSPGQISLGREPSDVLVLAPGSSFAANLNNESRIPKTEGVEGEDEGTSSLENKCGDSSFKADLKLAPEVMNIATPIVITVAEQLARTMETINKPEKEDLPSESEVKPVKNSHNSSPPSPTGLRFKEEFLTVSSTEERTESTQDIPPDGVEIDSPMSDADTLEVEDRMAVEPTAVDKPYDKLEHQADNLAITDLPESERIKIDVPKTTEVESPALEVPTVISTPKPEEAVLTLKGTPTTTPSLFPRKREAPRPPEPEQRLPSKTGSTKEVWKKNNYYPAELNPFESEEQIEIESKNPFEDEDEKTEDIPKPFPKVRSSRGTVNSISNNNKLRSQSTSPGPQPQPSPSPSPSPKPRTIVKNNATVEQKPFNPFEDEEDEESGVFLRDETSSTCSRFSDGSSFNSNVSSTPAHPIPKPRDRDRDSLTYSNVSETNSMKLKSRKTRRAPLPPSFMQQQQRHEDANTSNENSSPPSPVPIPKSPKSILKRSQQSLNEISNFDVRNNEGLDRSGASSPGPKKVIPASPKLLKGLKNHTNQAASQQYRKKRRAPPPRRRVEPLPEASIKTEMEDLGVQERELERQGITLESTIRRLMETETESNNDQVDEMMVQLWNIINEKNDILRRQTELEYLRRGHRLEEMQAELEFQLRVLMDTPLNQRQEDHTHVENTLLEEMLKLVDERNEVVDWLDFHRRQDREEATRVSQSLTSFSTINRKSDTIDASQKEIVLTTLPRMKSSKKSKKEKDKDKQSKEKKNGTKEKDKEDKKIKFGTLFGRRKSKGRKDKLDEDKDFDESLSVNKR